MDTGQPTSHSSSAPRLAPDRPFPPYSYVTGQFPHPTRDANGHSFGKHPEACPTPNPNQWRDSTEYLYGLDLFNHGYYWEAHEVWEGVWNACGRGGTAGNFIKGLIKLAAAGVKVREGRMEGLHRHALRAAELFRQTADRLSHGELHYFGLSLARLIGLADELALGKTELRKPIGKPVEIVFPFLLRPEN